MAFAGHSRWDLLRSENAHPIFQKGELVYQKPDLKEIMAYADQQIQTLWPEYLRLVNPEEMWVQRSAKLSALRDKVLKEESAHFF